MKKKEAETLQKEVIHIMTPKIMNSLKAELTKMAQAAENKKCKGELTGMLLFITYDSMYFDSTIVI